MSKEQTRSNAASGGGRDSYFRLPEGVREWYPEKADTYKLDFLPYEVQTNNHPDGVDKGRLWYKFPFFIHKHIGVRDENVVCPTSIGKPCPICEQRSKLTEDWDKNEKAIKALNYQKIVAFIIKDPDDEDKVALFAWSFGKFAKPLAKEIKLGGDEIVSFYDVTDEGRTLKVRFSEESFQGDDGKSSKFLQASRIDFLPREAMDEDEIIEKTPCLDHILDVMPYDKLKALFLQLEEDGSASSSETQTPAKAKSAKSEPTEEPPAATTFDVGDRVGFTIKGKALTGEVTEVDDDDVTIKGDDGDEYELEMDDLSPAPAKSKSKSTPATPAKSAPAAATEEAKFPIGTRVQFTYKGKDYVGDVTAIDDDDYTVECSDGKDREVDVDDLELVDGGTDGTGSQDTPTEAAPTYAVGDAVTWDDGDESGTIVKIDEEGERAKCQTASGKEWVAFKDLAPAQPTTKKPAAAEAPAKAGKKATAAPAAESADTPTCPHKGGIFGKHCDKHAECDECPHWKACAKVAAGK